MPEAVYILCALTSLTCAFLLGRAYWLKRVPLLFWSTVCFGALAVNNILLFVDLIVMPGIDLQPLRTLFALVGVSTLLYGLAMEAK
ncbi:MAG: DUF5985 family protein [Verrucomicrobiota bacterium]